MKLSIIIPIYRAEDTLERCIGSILQQSFTSYELILVDDGSPDACPLLMHPKDTAMTNCFKSEFMFIS